MFQKARNLYLRAGVGLTASALAVIPSAAFAQDATGIGTIATNMNSQLKQFPAIISYAAYLGGCGLGMAGILKLREHVDSPQQVKMKDGLVRCASGGALVALPYMINAFVGTVAGGSGSATTSIPSLSQ